MQSFINISVQQKVVTLTFDRPKRKNALRFETYAALGDWFCQLAHASDIKAVVMTGTEDNFCSGGDVHDIIGPLTQREMPELLEFTRMTSRVVQAMRACPQPMIAAVDGVCAGAGAALALACDIRFGTARSKTAFLFSRVGLAGCDMGVTALLPRVIGMGRASELLYSGRAMGGEEAERCGFFNRLCSPDVLLGEAQAFALELANGPTVAHAMTKKMLQQEWNMSLEEALEAEAQAQAECMTTQDFKRAYQAFVAKVKPVFEGN